MRWTKITQRLRFSRHGVLLLLVLAVALGLRLYGISWDSGYGFHPDERSIYMQSDCMYRLLSQTSAYSDCIRDYPETVPGFPSPEVFFDSERSPLNPHWFPLGSVLLYLMVIFRFLLSPFTDISALDMSYVGRPLSALADVGGVLVVYFLGRRMYGRGVGLLAAALVTLAVVHIQNSHFYRPETIIALLVLTSVLFMLRLLDHRRLRDSALLGLMVGLAFAIKVSVLPLVLPLFFTYGILLLTRPGGGLELPSLRRVGGMAGHVVLATGVSLVIFTLLTPYAFIDMAEFIKDTTWEANIARTAGQLPYTIQYIGATPFWYELRQTTLWGLGLPLGVVAWVGLLFTVVMVVRNRATRKGDLLLLLWVVPNIILVSTFEVKFLRYIFSVMPFLIIMGSRMLFSILDWAKAHSRKDQKALVDSRTAPLTDKAGAALKGALTRYAPHVALGGIALVVAATGFYAVAFETVYSRPHPAMQASRWINDNVPRGSTILTDNHWDEGIPELYSYRVQQIPIYETDSPAKVERLAGQLAQADYLVFYSNRTYGSIARVPDKYPLSAGYYQLLFAGELGYELERTFTSYPRLMGLAFVHDPFSRAGIPEPDLLKEAKPAAVTFNLGYADDNVANYDHPQVLLFRNEGKLSRSMLLDHLQRGEQFLTVSSELGLMLTPSAKEIQRKGGTWSGIIRRDSWTNRVPILAWLLLVELIFVATLPLALFLFRPLADRGVVLAKLLGILGVSYVAWLLASLGWMGFSRASVLAGLLTMGALSTFVLTWRWRDFMDFLRTRWKVILTAEVLFFVAFLSFVAIRMANPDLWHPFYGGEKPMDFAYLNAVLRSTLMPPYDPWFAGGYLNYYYWGQFIVATLIKATGIVPSVAYNLAVPLLFALTVTASYSLVYNVVSGLGRRGLRSPILNMGPTVAGLVAALFVAVMGNLHGLVQLALGVWKSAIGPPLTGFLWFTERIGGQPFPSFSYWFSSRMLPELEDANPSVGFWLPDRQVFSPNVFCPSGLRPDNTCADISPHITEFPFFSFLFADLHAHLIAIPFTLLALGLAFSLLVGLRRGRPSWFIPTIFALAVAVGSLWAINSADYPAYMVLALLLIGVGVYLRPESVLRRWGLFVALAVAIVFLSLLTFLPFHVFYQPSNTGLEVSKWPTPLANYMGIHGLFIFLATTFLIYLLRVPLLRFVRVLAHYAHTFWTADGLQAPDIPRFSPAAIGWALAVAAIIYLAVAGYLTAALLGVLLALTLWAAREVLKGKGENSVYLLLPLVMLGWAFVLGIGVEFVRVEDDIGRMNTLFKYYLQAWVLFGLASSTILGYLAYQGFLSLRRISVARGAWIGILALLLISSFIYTVLGTRTRLAERFDTSFVTLDGAAFMTRAVHRDRVEGQLIDLGGDYKAIRWLQDNVEGSPVVLEAHNVFYTWSSRISDYTGLPTVLGWPWHQIQQRGKYDYAVRARSTIVREMYSTTNTARALDLLRQYEVAYVVVSQLEQAYYPAQGLKKFDALTSEGLAKLVYDNEGTKIYRGLW